MITLKESLYDIISPTKEIAEGILDTADIETGVDDEIAKRNAKLISFFSGVYKCPAEIKNGTLYLKSNGKVLQMSFVNPDTFEGCTIKHVVCDGTYTIKEYYLDRVAEAGIESITAPVIRIEGRCHMDDTFIKQVKLVADSFVLAPGERRGQISTVENITLKCKKNIKIQSEAASYGDELILKNVTVDCNKLILVSHQNLNMFNGRGPSWRAHKFTDLGLTPNSKFKQIDCLDLGDKPEGIRYSKKKPAGMDSQYSFYRDKCWEMEDKPGFYCDGNFKGTKASYKV